MTRASEYQYSCRLRKATNLGTHQLGTLKAHTAQRLEHSGEEADVVHGFGQLDMSKISRAVQLASIVYSAATRPIGWTHLQVAQPIQLGLAGNCGAGAGDSPNRPSSLRTNRAAGSILAKLYFTSRRPNVSGCATLKAQGHMLSRRSVCIAASAVTVQLLAVCRHHALLFDLA